MDARTARRLIAAVALGCVTSMSVSVAGEPLSDLRSADAAVRAAALRDVVRRAPAELRSSASALRPAIRRALTDDAAPDVRGAAARALFRLDGEAAIPHVLAAMRAERDPDAERLLATAWDVAPPEPSRRALYAAAEDRKDLRLAALAAEALGSLAARTGRDDLLALLDEGLPWPVVAGACLALRSVPEIPVVTAIVRRLRHPDTAVRSAARETLVFLTGADQGPDPNDWETWWTKAREGFRFPDGEPAAGAAPGGPVRASGPGKTSDAASDTATWARFFGVPIRGRRVAFVIDYSQSMWGERRTKAERELIEAVKGLPTTSRATVILFNEKVWRFRPAPVPGRPQEKLDLVSYLPELETKSYTNIHDALETALGLLGSGREAVTPPPGVDDVILLSDGVPNRGLLKHPDRIVEALTLLNGGRARVHCVALAEEGADLLRRLAKENGGQFVAEFVAK